ncbi:hypothetical protein AGR1C_pAt20188 [Agrobacterium fabacearum TT111]|nr:hypothetical protein AGR1C_pAt20188 [Agrobacterium fabacearum TT111]
MAAATNESCEHHTKREPSHSIWKASVTEVPCIVAVHQIARRHLSQLCPRHVGAQKTYANDGLFSRNIGYVTGIRRTMPSSECVKVWKLPETITRGPVTVVFLARSLAW